MSKEKTIEELIFDINSWEINEYASFLKSVYSCGENYLLSEYTVQDLVDNNVRTYKFKGADFGFAIKPDDMGNDIILLHNSDELYKGKHLIKKVMEFAVSCGGDHFDYYETPKLKHIYSNIGFSEYERYPFIPEYVSPDWDYEKYGMPDVVYVKLKK